MPIDLVALDKKIKKLQLIRQLASDPDVAPLLSDLASANGTAAQHAQKPPVERKHVRYDVLRYVGDASNVQDYRTAKQIMAMMEADKYKFQSKRHGTTVRESLRALEKENLVAKAGTQGDDGAALWRKV
jgi:hypothetical protein